jgi:hypothetical protein
VGVTNERGEEGPVGGMRVTLRKAKRDLLMAMDSCCNLPVERHSKAHDGRLYATHPPLVASTKEHPPSRDPAEEPLSEPARSTNVIYAVCTRIPVSFSAH